MQNIKVYTKKRCPYCVSAKIWLSQRNYKFEEISLDDQAQFTQFKEQYPGLKTVPQIFVGIENIGGFSELIKSKLA